MNRRELCRGDIQRIIDDIKTIDPKKIDMLAEALNETPFAIRDCISALFYEDWTVIPEYDYRYYEEESHEDDADGYGTEEY